jgi:hypothetical protein
MRKPEFIGTVRSNKGEFSVHMVVPGRDSLVVAPADWPVRLAPGTLNIGVNDDGFPEGFEEIGEGDGLKKFDEGKFRPELAIPPWRIAGNTLPPIPDQPMRGAAQVWRAELQVIFTDRAARCWMLRRIGSGIVSQIELVAQEHLRSRLNLCDDMAVKVTVWEAESKVISLPRLVDAGRGLAAPRPGSFRGRRCRRSRGRRAAPGLRPTRGRGTPGFGAGAGRCPSACL